jgi:REP element-mobilizing transposase RayT
MSRPQRIVLGGYVCHVLNRANGRVRTFRKQSDFLAFEKILAESAALFSMCICGCCIMGDHWYLLLWAQGDGNLDTVNPLGKEL